MIPKVQGLFNYLFIAKLWDSVPAGISELPWKLDPWRVHCSSLAVALVTGIRLGSYDCVPGMLLFRCWVCPPKWSSLSLPFMLPLTEGLLGKYWSCPSTCNRGSKFCGRGKLSQWPDRSIRGTIGWSHSHVSHFALGKIWTLTLMYKNWTKEVTLECQVLIRCQTEIICTLQLNIGTL